MKSKKLIKAYYSAIIKKDVSEQRKLWKKILKKSLKGKRTHVVK